MPIVTPPKLDYIGRGIFELRTRAVYQTEHVRVEVPAGFRTDLASIPRIFWPLLPANGWYETAAVFHDRLCVELAEGTCGISSRDTDRLFRTIARENAVCNRLGAWIVSWILWVGVRWGALFNPARRRGWWRDAPLVLGISLLLAVVVVAGFRLADRILHAVF